MKLNRTKQKILEHANDDFNDFENIMNDFKKSKNNYND
jgi:hypothetical protein